MSRTDGKSHWSRKRELILVAIALLVLVVDQLSKQCVVLRLRLGVPWNPIEWLGSYVSLTYITNTGAAFGMFPAFGTFFAVIAIVVVVVILLYYRQLSSGSWTMHIGLGLQLGGALGNLLDRIRWGHVVDFIDFKVWPVFNVADASIVVGVALLALGILWDGERDTEETAAAGAQDPAD